MNRDWVAAVRSLVVARRQAGWIRTVHGRGWTRDHVYGLGDTRVAVNDAWVITLSKRSRSLQCDWRQVLSAVPEGVDQAADYLVAAGILPSHLSTAYGHGAADGVAAARAALIQGLMPRLEVALREEILAVKL